MTLTLVPKKRPYHSHVKYKSLITYHSKVMANVTDFCRQTDRRTKRQTETQTQKKLYASNLSGVWNSYARLIRLGNFCRRTSRLYKGTCQLKSDRITRKYYIIIFNFASNLWQEMLCLPGSKVFLQEASLLTPYQFML